MARLNDSWNEDSATVQVDVPDAATCTWAAVKSQTAITDGLWYCANDAETITISGDTATVSNVTRKVTTSAHGDDTGLQTYTVYQGSGSAVID